jgi:hypothetical protein
MLAKLRGPGASRGETKVLEHFKFVKNTIIKIYFLVRKYRKKKTRSNSIRNETYWETFCRAYCRSRIRQKTFIAVLYNM